MYTFFLNTDLEMVCQLFKVKVFVFQYNFSLKKNLFLNNLNGGKFL